MGGDEFIQHSHALMLDQRSLDNAAADGSFIGVPLTNGFSDTQPRSRRTASGDLIDTFGFVLEPNGYLLNFDTYAINTPNQEGRGTRLREGQWTADGNLISKEICFYSNGDNDRVNVRYPDCGASDGWGGDVYKRSWNQISAVDLDEDGVYDRLYAIERLLALYPKDDACNNDPNLNCVDGHPVRWDESRLNYYQRLPEFNFIDLDQDGVLNTEDVFPFDPAETNDSDGDGIGDNSDSDVDGDGIDNEVDNCPIANDDQLDTDDDGLGDACDPDKDGDGRDNSSDAFPLDPTETHDSDGDGVGNTADDDDDNDGIDDTLDPRPVVAACPLGTTEIDVSNDSNFSGRFGDDIASFAPSVCQLPQQITEELVLDPRSDYIISGPVVVGNGDQFINEFGDLSDGSQLISTRLVIPAGTRLYADYWHGNNPSYLKITRGSQLIAEGTAEAPIVMSVRGLGYGQTADWGGVIIQGVRSIRCAWMIRHVMSLLDMVSLAAKTTVMTVVY